jgi:hypothetical protein
LPYFTASLYLSYASARLAAQSIHSTLRRSSAASSGQEGLRGLLSPREFFVELISTEIYRSGYIRGPLGPRLESHR